LWLTPIPQAAQLGTRTPTTLAQQHQEQRKSAFSRPNTLVPARFLAKVTMFTALMAFSGATAGLALHREPFYTWYYCFAWWSYILFAQAWLYFRGGLRCCSEPQPVSSASFQCRCRFGWFSKRYNLRLDNWSYIDVPVSLGVRWTGYVISFATVLPAIFTTADLLEHSGIIPSADAHISRHRGAITRR